MQEARPNAATTLSLRGETSTEYARNLEHDVPRLVAEAWDLRTGF